LKQTSKLVQGKAGTFDVAVDGKLIYSRHQTGRFPDAAEIIDALRKRRPA